MNVFNWKLLELTNIPVIGIVTVVENCKSKTHSIEETLFLFNIKCRVNIKFLFHCCLQRESRVQTVTCDGKRSRRASSQALTASLPSPTYIISHILSFLYITYIILQKGNFIPRRKKCLTYLFRIETNFIY